MVAYKQSSIPSSSLEYCPNCTHRVVRSLPQFLVLFQPISAFVACSLNLPFHQVYMKHTDFKEWFFMISKEISKEQTATDLLNWWEKATEKNFRQKLDLKKPHGSVFKNNIHNFISYSDTFPTFTLWFLCFFHCFIYANQTKF